MSAPKTAIPLPLEELAVFCRKWKIAKLEVFGSILRDDFGPESDVDFLYTWEPDAHWGFAMTRLGPELEALLHRRVDLISRQQLDRSYNWALRQSILQETAVVYAA